MLIASIAMGAVSMKIHNWLVELGKPMRLGFEALVLGLSIGLGLATLYGACQLMRIEELDIAKGAVRRKLSRFFPTS